MNVTSKSRYALKIMMDLTEHSRVQATPVAQRNDIAMRQGIPFDYLDQNLSRLRPAGLVGSVRGRSGGYRLLKAAEDVSVWEIFQAVEDGFQPVQCLEGGVGCVSEHHCSSKDAWGLISSAIRSALSGIILGDLIHRRELAAGLEALVSHTQECRAPKRRAGGSRLL